MNRLTILQCIRTHVAADAIDPKISRPLGEIVLEIGKKIRGNDSEVENGSSHPVGLTAIQLVAAFVDGGLSTEEESQVCAAIVHDNSVLAEVVASVRVEYERELLPKLPSDFIDRLVGVASDSPAVSCVSHPEAPTLTISDSTQASSSTRVSDGINGFRNRTSQFLVLAGSLAAVLLAAIGSWVFLGNDIRRLSKESIAQVPGNSQSQIKRSQEPTESVEVALSEPDIWPNPPVAQLDAEIQEPVDPEPSEVEEDSTSDLASNLSSESESLKLSERNSMEIPALVSKGLGALQWTRIQGVLARSQNEDGGSNYSSESRWEGTEQGTSIAQKEFETQTVYLSTLPFSRAEGELSNGGKLVMAPDSSMSIYQDEMGLVQLRLERGEFALSDMPVETAIEVWLEDHPLTLLKWHSQGTVVMSSSSTGVLVQVDGTIDCSGNAFEDCTLRLGEEIERLGPKSRIPAWVNRNIESVNLPKTILAQLSTSKDLVGSLQELSRGQYSKADSITWGKFSSWAALSSRHQMEHVFAQGNFLQRSIAIDRLLNLPAWAGSSRKLWQALMISSKNPEQVRLMANLTEQLRRNRPFGAGQVEQLLKSLESQDPATRSVADALLRRNYGSGPNYNPILPQANSPRAILLWRRFVSAR